MGVRKFVHFLCEAESQMKQGMKENIKNIMHFFTALLHHENLINIELKSLLDMSVSKLRDPKDTDISNYSLMNDYKQRNSSFYKSIESDRTENGLNECIIKKQDNLMLNDNEKNEQMNKSNSMKTSNLGLPSSLGEKILSEYSGELSESMHEKKGIEHSEYKILINDDFKEFRSCLNFKVDHSVSEKQQDGFGLHVKFMNISLAFEEDAKNSSENMQKTVEKKKTNF